MRTFDGRLSSVRPAFANAVTLAELCTSNVRKFETPVVASREPSTSTALCVPLSVGRSCRAYGRYGMHTVCTLPVGAPCK